jgi:hypothetical protein
MKKEAKDLNIKDKEFAKLMEEMLLIQRQVKDGKSEEYIQELYDQKIEAEKE